jgi:hypothetical protein
LAKIDGSKGARAAGRETTEIKVELAKCEERAETPRPHECSRSRKSAVRSKNRAAAGQMPEGEASRWAFSAPGRIADLYLRKETFATDRRDGQPTQTCASSRVDGRVRRFTAGCARWKKLHALIGRERGASPAGDWPTGGIASSWRYGAHVEEQ